MSTKPSRIPARARKPAAAHAVGAANPPTSAVSEDSQAAQSQSSQPEGRRVCKGSALTEFHADFAEMVKKLPLSTLKDVKTKLAKLGADPASASPACGQALSDAVARYERKRARARESSAAKRAAKVSPIAE